MREMKLFSMITSSNNRERMRMITTQASYKTRSEEELILLIKATRNRFKKNVASGRLTVISDREWRLQ